MLKPLITAFCAIFISSSLIAGEKGSAVKTYPSPGDLSSVQGLEESRKFDLQVNDQDVFVYHGFEIKDEYEWYGDAGTMVDSPSYNGVSFTSFETCGPVELQIKTKQKLETWSLKPLAQEAKQIDSHTIVAKIDGPQKLFFDAQFEDSSEHDYLIISAEKPMNYNIDPNDKSVLYFERGVHSFKNQAWDPFVDGIKTVYLEPGAVVEAT